MITCNKKTQLPRFLYILAMAVFFQLFAVSNAPAPVTPPREDPLVGFNYALSVDGLITGYFAEVSGIGSENEIVEHKVVDGSGKESVQKLPGRLKWSDVTLKRGITSSMDMWNWRKMVEDGNVAGARKNFSIMLFDQTYAVKAQWDFINGWPAKIEVPAATSTANAGAVESITIVHEGMVRVQ
jgi:phage tail-like protein